MKKQPLRKKLRDDLFYLLVRGFTQILRITPRRPALKFMRVLGRFAFLVARAPRQRTITHLTRVYGAEKTEQEIMAMARGVFIHFATAAGDVLRMPNLIHNNNINKLVTARGLEHLDKAFKTGKGMIMATCHFGNWEVMGTWLALNGYKINAVGATMFDPRLNKILIETRNSAGYNNIARGKGTREILRTLKKGEGVGILIDQDTSVPGVFVDFFGKPAHTPTGPAILARRLDVPILPLFMHLNEDLSYELECQPPLELVKTDNEENDILVNTRMISDTYEAVIRRHPEQWVWMHKRWNSQPKPESGNN